jgi:hypothetical protein
MLSSAPAEEASDIVADAENIRGKRAFSAATIDKKEPPLPAAQGDNREASNRVDRSHSMSRRWTISVMNEKA